jgi:hypothetical protein
MCSEECRAINIKRIGKAYRDTERELYLASLPTRICQECGKEFKPVNPKMTMCSHSCALTWGKRRAMQYEKNKRAQKRIEKERAKKKVSPLVAKSIEATEEGTTYGKLELRSYLEQQSEEMAKRRREMEIEWERKRNNE